MPPLQERIETGHDLRECLLNGVLASDNRRMGLENGFPEEPNSFVCTH
jgi:hypothetical protein